MVDKELEEEIKVIGLTKYLINLPSPKLTVFLILAVSFIASLLGYCAMLGCSDIVANLPNILFLALLYLATPAFFSSIINTMASRFSRKEIILKRSLFLSFFGLLIVSSLFVIACLFSSFFNGKYFYDIMIFAYTIVLAEQVFIIMVTHPYNMLQTVMVSLVYPLIGILVMKPVKFLSLLPMEIAAVNPITILLKFSIATTVVLLGIWLFVYVVNAPMKRNFNVKSIEMAKLFLGHWYDYSSAIEDKLKQMGTKAKTWIGILSFKKGSKLKVLLVTPYLHPGPFGEVGGSKLSKIFSDTLEEETGANVIVTHGTVTFDLNPLTTDSLYHSCEQVLEEIPKIKYSKSASAMIRCRDGDLQMSGQLFGNTVFMTSTLSPKPTEDIDFAVGVAAMNELKESFPNAIYADCHNCYHNAGDYAILSANPKFFNILNAARKLGKLLKREKKRKIKAGYAHDPMSNYSLEEGIGPTGLRVLVLSVGGIKNAYIIFDANNMEVGLRDRIIEAVRKLGIDDAEVMTTDSHIVNNLRGVENPLGMKIDTDEIVNHVVDTVRRALNDLEEVEVGGKTVEVSDIDVFGPQKAAEIVATIDSLVSVMKIVGPIIFISSLFLAFVLQTSVIGW